MTVSRHLGLLSAALAAGALALGYSLAGLPLWPLPILGGGLLWVVGGARGWGRIFAWGVVACALLAAVGLAQAVGFGWMLLALVAAVTAWDLDRFAQTPASPGRAPAAAGRVEGARQMERRHLQRLGLVNLAGLSLGAAAFLLQTRLHFVVVVLLLLLAAWGLSQAVTYLRRESR
jgi:hypothetical protein